MLYLEREELKEITSDKTRNYIVFCDECMKEIGKHQKVIYFNFSKGGSFCSCEKCLPKIMKDITVE